MGRIGLILASALIAFLLAPFSAAAATSESADVGMPFDGKWAYNASVAPPYTDANSSHPSVHKISGGSDWATDIYGRSGQEVRLRVSSSTGNLSFSWRPTSTSCGTSTGVNVYVDGQAVGWLYLAHLSGAVNSGAISNGMLLGRVGNFPSCAPGNHIHVEMKSDPGNASCYQDYGRPGTSLATGQRLGGLGATGASGPRQPCGGAGAPTIPNSGGGNPFGHLDSLTRAPGGLRAQGWVIDPDTAAPIDAHLYSGNGNPGGGNPGAATRADRDRPDVAAAFPGKGPAHGFDVTVPARAAGPQTACIYGINVGVGNTNPRVGCGTLNVSPDPYGHLDVVRRVPGGVEASGWSIDPDSGAAIAVHVYGGNGNPGGGPGVATTADRDRPDVGNVYPNYGSRHGFTVFLPTSGAPQRFCAYGINNGPGINPQIGCIGA